MDEREKIIAVIEKWADKAVVTKIHGASVYDPYNAAELADALISAGISDVTEAEHRAEIARLTAERNDSKIEYHGYHTYVRYSAADKVLYGKIEGIKDLVDFESESAVEVENEFHKAVDDYIAFCREVGKNVEEEERK